VASLYCIVSFNYIYIYLRILSKARCSPPSSPKWLSLSESLAPLRLPSPNLAPQAQAQIKSQSTPLKSNSHTHSLQNQNYKETRQDNYNRMDKCLIGPQSVDEFMETFMPNMKLPEDFEKKDGLIFLNFQTAFDTEKKYAKAVVCDLPFHILRV
jgi:hypothetical protein